VEIASWQIAN